MDPESVDRLESFLSQFNLTDLGDGDHVAGANSLAATLCSIANLSRPGSFIAGKNERAFEIGANLVVSGGLSSSLCSEHIGSPLAQYQDSLESHMRGFLRAAEVDQEKGLGRRKWSAPPEFDPSPSESVFFSLQQPEHISLQPSEKDWEDVLSSRPQTTREELYRKTRVYLRTSEPSQTIKCLAHAHNGKPFLHFDLHSSTQFRTSQLLLSRIIDGYNVGSSLPSLHQGSILVEDPCNSFRQVIRENPDDFSRLVWLLDGGPGMDLPEPKESTMRVTQPVEFRHLRQSLLTAFARRVDHHQIGPQTISHDLSQLHAKWVRFLGTQEGDYPGITGFAKNLLATLLFGLQGISHAYRAEYGKPLHASGLYEFAQYLILRSGAARKSTLHAEEIERDSQLKIRIVARLQSKSLDNRDLYRSLSIPAAKCEQLLGELEQDGAVRRKRNQWLLTSNYNEHLELLS